MAFDTSVAKRCALSHVNRIGNKICNEKSGQITPKRAIMTAWQWMLGMRYATT